MRSTFSQTIAWISGVCLALTATLAITKQPPADAVEQHSLEKVDSRFFDEFLIAAGAQLSNYTKVMIAEPHIAFDERWLRDNRRHLTQHYKKRTLERYTKLLSEELMEAFAAQDKYTLVNEKDAETLVVNARIPDLQINGPDWGPQVRQFVFHAGDATLEIDLEDAQGSKLAYFRDHRETRHRGFGFNRPERTSSVQNRQDFRHLMERWSDEMVDHIAMN